MREYIDNIEVRPHLRPLNQETVDLLAASIERIGLQVPVTLYVDDDVPVLVAGQHRLAAVKQLGHEFIEAVYIKLDEIERELWQIDENLIRSELNELQRAQHFARRKELFDAINSVSKKDTIGRPKGFDTDTAEKTGVGRNTVHKSRTRAENIAEDVQGRVVDTDIADSGVELDALKSLSHDEQRAVIDRVEETGETVREASVFVTGDDPEMVASEKRIKAAYNAFVKLNDDERKDLWGRLETAGYLEALEQ